MDDLLVRIDTGLNLAQWVADRLEIPITEDESPFALLAEARDEIERLRAVIKAYQQLTVAYRVGKRPTEKVLDTLQAFHVAEAAKEED